MLLPIKKKGKLNKEYLSQSLALYGDFFSDGYFDDFSKKVLGNIHAVNLLDVRDRFLDEILSFTKSHIGQRKSTYKLTMTELLQHFESFPTGIQEDVINWLKIAGFKLDDKGTSVAIKAIKEKRFGKFFSDKTKCIKEVTEFMKKQVYDTLLFFVYPYVLFQSIQVIHSYFSFL